MKLSVKKIKKNKMHVWNYRIMTLAELYGWNLIREDDSIMPRSTIFIIFIKLTKTDQLNNKEMLRIIKYKNQQRINNTLGQTRHYFNY